ncbi:MAG: ATP synthase F1 subunit delta [Phycisphaerae bacterium]
MSGIGQRPDSVMDPQETPLADMYAEALLGLLPTDEHAEEIATQLQSLAEMTWQVDGFGELLSAAGDSVEERQAMIERVFRGRVDDTLADFLGVLAGHERLHLLRGVARRFRRQLWARQGAVEVEVVSAVELDEDSRRRIETMLAEALEAKPILHVRVDASILGGLVIRLGDRVFDASVQARLDTLRQSLRRRVRQITQPDQPNPMTDGEEA